MKTNIPAGKRARANHKKKQAKKQTKKQGMMMVWKNGQVVPHIDEPSKFSPPTPQPEKLDRAKNWNWGWPW